MKIQFLGLTTSPEIIYKLLKYSITTNFDNGIDCIVG